MPRSCKIPCAWHEVRRVHAWSSWWWVITINGILSAYIAPRFWSQATFSDRDNVDET